MTDIIIEFCYWAAVTGLIGYGLGLALGGFWFWVLP